MQIIFSKTSEEIYFKTGNNVNITLKYFNRTQIGQQLGQSQSDRGVLVQIGTNRLQLAGFLEIETRLKLAHTLATTYIEQDTKMLQMQKEKELKLQVIQAKKVSTHAILIDESIERSGVLCDERGCDRTVEIHDLYHFRQFDLEGRDYNMAEVSGEKTLAERENETRRERLLQ